ncbi:MAG: DUF503 domain-containing protein [Candidatus Palauibacterales bacterium]|nr:DUF503 domain-containing protein [Candidatus Palauibacterales bacterium]MDP2530507.1 DUF503 domain-containing protein [Candidatus Palauibacterales bacterium]MDP2582934.1 DUF503 domain-containing protein [Candidatus Palauibacterales bacterium]
MSAVVGVARWVLHLPGCRSLKAKRKVVHSLRDRMRSRFGVSVAETDLQDEWQRAELCAALVTSDRRLAESILSKLDDHVASDPRAHVVEHETVLY